MIYAGVLHGFEETGLGGGQFAVGLVPAQGQDFTGHSPGDIGVDQRRLGLADGDPDQGRVVNGGEIARETDPRDIVGLVIHIDHQARIGHGGAPCCRSLDAPFGPVPP
ncbi:MAG: hypothetical protein B7Y85_10315 [Brevundimonas sp. 32-68-21]|nr:MAG: hypothetical protein B7Y85_10315 [Brevundimonas sp. 32-68-21]